MPDKLVVSIKSTASKLAGYYGYNSVLLFKCFNLNKSELFHLEYLFGDGAPVKFINNFNEIKKVNSKNFFKKVIYKSKFKDFKKYLKK